MSSTAKTAIVLIDPYNDFLHPEGKANQLLAESMADTNTIFHLKNLVTVARAHKIPIYYGLHQQIKAGFLAGWNHATSTQVAQKEGKAFEEGTWGVEIFEGLEPDVEGNADVVVSKHWCSSSFQNTDLEYQLRQRDITHLVFAGLTANTCMESTARYAFELGFRVTMLKDATAGFSTVLKDAATDLIWPLFANEVLTVEEWKKSLEK
ncbi:ecb77a03-a94c-42bc-a7a0-b8805ec4927c [Sclerotinia trifoliorum]|uniref:Ecb77a03-a94c-42bc-a7a0-b8805ec4927c n=1 Tax=Sclerotinia trifoliorum TaxID=28548 RepID=A0A8H2W0K9_9HELO|nr:ecb77a03-a94c-42bc-a7a0-b8805ec4927c [Sclerotinia trifoliorum]